MGGDAPAGYDQFMDNKGLLIAGASIVAGAVLGRMRLPDLESLEHFGARGAVSGRPFNPDLAGGPIENLTTDGVTINREGIAIVEKHIARFGHDPVNEVMINRLKDIEKGKIPPEQVDLNFYTHECREYQRYCNLGWETGQPDGDAGYALWNHTHTATLEEYKLKGELNDLYHQDALDYDN
ncbi:colicin [Escherichia coli]|nr:colicin [Escherichia coli]